MTDATAPSGNRRGSSRVESAVHPNRTPRRVAVLAATLATALAVAAVVLVAGPAASDDPSPANPPTTSPDADTPNAPGAPSALPDGEHVGRIVAAYVAPDELVLRRAELLVGAEARAAAAEDGAEATDFYVRESTGGPVTVPVAPDVVVTTVDCNAGCREGAPSDYATLTRSADGSGLYRLWVLDGVVVGIDAVYLP